MKEKRNLETFNKSKQAVCSARQVGTESGEAVSQSSSLKAHSQLNGSAPPAKKEQVVRQNKSYLQLKQIQPFPFHKSNSLSPADIWETSRAEFG